MTATQNVRVGNLCYMTFRAVYKQDEIIAAEMKFIRIASYTCFDYKTDLDNEQSK
jgi:hypothetical protein